jgi:DNA-binding transcriptional LysR family regulator
MGGYGMNYRGLDLNQLVSLQVLLDERHVTRSAEQLGITQPAMSASLARLRTLFDDQLLVRSPQGLMRTPRAEQLHEQLGRMMAIVEQITSTPVGFEPSTSQRSFSLIGTDFVEVILLPQLSAVLAKEAPSIEIIFKGPDPKSIEGAMAAGSLDIAIGYLPEAPNALIKSTLFREPFVCIARRGHPALQDGVLSLDRFVEMQHVQALMKDGTMYAAAIDTALANHGLVRKVALWQPSFFALPHVVERTDLIGTVPKRVGVHAAENLAIEIYEVPLPLPQPEFALYWHERSRDDLGHRWLRDRIAALMRVQSD